MLGFKVLRLGLRVWVLGLQGFGLRVYSFMVLKFRGLGNSGTSGPICYRGDQGRATCLELGTWCARLSDFGLQR